MKDVAVDTICLRMGGFQLLTSDSNLPTAKRNIYGMIRSLTCCIIETEFDTERVRSPTELFV